MKEKSSERGQAPELKSIMEWLRKDCEIRARLPWQIAEQSANLNWSSVGEQARCRSDETAPALAGAIAPRHK